MTFVHALPIAFLLMCVVWTLMCLAQSAYDFLLDRLIERAFPSAFLDGPATSRTSSTKGANQ